MQKRPVAIITGATAGIGLATAKALSQAGYDLIITGRREDRLLKIAQKLSSKKCTAYPFCFDVSKRQQVRAAFRNTESILKRTEVLVNNAGLALGVDLVDQANLDHWDQMIDTNIKGLLYMIRLVLPYMKANDRGHIINLGSVAGRWMYKGGAVYASTKFAVRAISEGLRMDLLGSRVRVTNIEPGLVDTEFSFVRFGDKTKAAEIYKDMKPLTGKDIADCILWSMSRPAHVNIQEMVVFPTDQAAVGQVHRHLKKGNKRR